MTATETTTTETLSSSPVRPPRGVLTVAGLAAFAAVALTPWLLSTSPETETSPMTPTLAAASPQHAAPGHASASSYAPNIEPLTAYAQFCQNSPTLCAPPATTTLASTGYLQFCWNSPTLCTLPNATNPGIGLALRGRS